MHSNIIFFQFLIFCLTGAVLKPPSSNMAKKCLYILQDLCGFFQISETRFFKKKIIS